MIKKTRLKNENQHKNVFLKKLKQSHTQSREYVRQILEGNLHSPFIIKKMSNDFNRHGAFFSCVLHSITVMTLYDGSSRLSLQILFSK